MGRGRPPNPVDPDASHAARLGAELRARRQARGLTLQALGELAGYAPQHVSQVELAHATPSPPFIGACDRVLEAQGALVELLPAAMHERAMASHGRAAARRAATLEAGAPVALR